MRISPGAVNSDIDADFVKALIIVRRLAVTLCLRSHLWDSFLYAAADADLAGPAVTLRCPDIKLAGVARSRWCRCGPLSMYSTVGCPATTR